MLTPIFWRVSITKNQNFASFGCCLQPHFCRNPACECRLPSSLVNFDISIPVNTEISVGCAFGGYHFPTPIDCFILASLSATFSLFFGLNTSSPAVTMPTLAETRASLPSLEVTASRTVAQLKDFLRDLDLSTIGNKATLVDRLWVFIQPPPPQAPPPPPNGMPDAAPIVEPNAMPLPIIDGVAPAILGNVVITHQQFADYQLLRAAQNVPPPPHAAPVNPFHNAAVAPHAAPDNPFLNAGLEILGTRSVDDSALFDGNDLFFGLPDRIQSPFEKANRDFYQNFFCLSKTLTAVMGQRFTTLFVSADDSKSPTDIANALITSMEAFKNTMDASTHHLEKLVTFPTVTLQLSKSFLTPSFNFLPDNGGAQVEKLQSHISVFSFLRPDTTSPAFHAAQNDNREQVMAATYSTVRTKNYPKSDKLYSEGCQSNVDDLKALVANLVFFCSF
jgi:hypothetical protein